jgi:oligopeptidase B
LRQGSDPWCNPALLQQGSDPWRNSGGVVGEVDEVGHVVATADTHRGVDLDEDALTRAELCGMDRVSDVALAHPRQAPRSAGIVEHLAAFDDIGDAVLELHEHVGAVIDTQAVTGAEVLIDPHTHGDRTVPLAVYIDSTVSPQADQTSDTPTDPATAATTAAPVAPRRPHTWHRPTGDVDDPYAWMRDVDDPELLEHLRAENAAAERFFAPHADTIETIFGEIRSRVQETDMSTPVEFGPWWYVTSTIEGMSYPVHHRGPSADRANDNVLLDENIEAEGHEFFDLGAFDVSMDHRMLAWSTDIAGDEHYTLRIRDLTTGADLDDRIDDTSNAGVAWSRDGQWVFYVTPDAQERPSTVWRHRLGTPHTDDVCVFEETDERFYVGIGSTRSEAWIVIQSGSRTSADARIVPTDRPTAEPVLVRPREPELEYQIEHWGDRFVVLTNLDAVDFKVMWAPLDDPATWSELIPHHADRRITGVEAFAGHLVIHEWADAQPRLRLLFTDGSGTSGGSRGARWRRAPRREHRPEPRVDQHVPAGHPPVAVAAAHGGRHRCRHHRADGREAHADTERRPVPLHGVTRMGHGARRHARADRHRPLGRTRPRRHGTVRAVRLRIVRIIDAAVVLGGPPLPPRPWSGVGARPSERGGELGRQVVSVAGKLLQKRTTFTDTLAAADHLVEQGWSAPGRLAVRGGSAGGLLVGACVHHAPRALRVLPWPKCPSSTSCRR